MPLALAQDLPAGRRGWSGLARAAPLALALAAACGKDITVHVRTGDRPPGDTHSKAIVSSASTTLVAGVAVDRVQIVLRDLRMQENPTPDGSSSPGDQAVSPATVLVDLAGDRLAPGALTEIVPARSLRWASFYQVVLDLRPVTAEEAAADAALAALGAGNTLKISGRMPGGAPFTFVSAVSIVLVRSAVFRAGLNHNNLTVNVALNRWFQGPAGEPLDPTTTDPAVLSTIEANILDSIDTYMDDNVDGLPDPLG
jgi:hypothetical protein